MSAPNAMVDSDLPPNGKDTFYVLEVNTIWKTKNLASVGIATWSELYNKDSFESDFGITESQFLRIVCATENLVYVLAVAKNSIGCYRPYILKTENGGLTWKSWCADDENLTYRNYKVYQYGPKTEIIDDANSATFDFEVERPADSNTFSPYAIATYLTTSDASGWGHLYTDGTTVQLLGETTSMFDTRGAANALLPDNKFNATALAMLDDYFGVGGWEHMAGLGHNMPKDDARVHIKFGIDSHGTPSQIATASCWTFWFITDVIVPRALAVAPTNNQWLYIGLPTKIRASEDGGETWFDFTSTDAENGANDICVDPQLAGAIYVWSPTGKLNLWIKGTGESHAATKLQDSIMTETADTRSLNFLRIARDLNSGKLWAIPNGTTIAMRENGANSNQKIGLTNTRGLHAYLGGHLICCENQEIYVTDDYGITWKTKTGGWGTYNNGLNGHRMKS